MNLTLNNKKNLFYEEIKDEENFLKERYVIYGPIKLAYFILKLLISIKT